MKTFHIVEDSSHLPESPVLQPHLCHFLSYRFPCWGLLTRAGQSESEWPLTSSPSVPLYSLPSLLWWPCCLHFPRQNKNSKYVTMWKGVDPGWVITRPQAVGKWTYRGERLRQRGSEFDQNPSSVSFHRIPVTTRSWGHSTSLPGVCLVKWDLKAESLVCIAGSLWVLRCLGARMNLFSESWCSLGLPWSQDVGTVPLV